MKSRLRKIETRERDAKGSGSRVLSFSARRTRYQPSLITLITDFGTSDYFAGAMKGVILAANPAARIVDITHNIPPHDIEAAAFTLLAAYTSFPAGTVHVVVVDPGVGSSRFPILVATRSHYFVGPDNGVFSYVCEVEAGTEVFHLDNAEYFRHPVSPTFNGRDVFAPVAAALSLGVAPHKLGSRLTDYVRLKPLKPELDRGGEIHGRVIHIDHFGNCITNLTTEELSQQLIDAGATLRIKNRSIKSFRNYFAEETLSREKVFGVWGSAGFLEVAAANESAARLLKARRGDPIIVRPA